MEKIILIGRLGSDPNMKYMQDGTPVTNFSLAVNRTWKGPDGERRERVTWFRVTVWRAQAEACNQYLSKGRQVCVEGRMNPDKETGGPKVFTRNDGSMGASYEMTALSVEFLVDRSDSDSGGTPRDADVPPEANIDEDSIPF